MVLLAGTKQKTHPDRVLGGQTYRKLLNGGWDFNNSIHTRSGIHSIHPYPAKFIPEIPRKLIEILGPPKGSIIFDPFCGSGTTLTEAQNCGYESVGVDLNPIARLISTVKTKPLSKLFSTHALRCYEAALKIQRNPPNNIPNLSHWFKPEISASIQAVRAAINISPSESKDALLLALSSIIVRVSNQESDTRYAAIDKKICQSQVFDLFWAACNRIKGALSNTSELPKATVIEKDILKVLPQEIPGSVGLVITSPPYPNAYEYWLYHKYRMWWLGFDPLKVKSQEIGARAHFFSGKEKAGDFYFQMESVFELLSKVCAPKSFVCFIVRDSKQATS